ncbi:MAG: zinc-binding dehydrogenase [Planctomycetes bacterium]|nr:zinc-binding dehydrogenase [Planctomycetota bacterium]
MDQPMPVAGENEVVIRVHYSGVSVGTEMSLATGKIDYYQRPPFIAGYQACGRIAQVGPKVENLAVGDWVAAFCGSGSHAVYAKAAASLTHKLADPSIAHEAAMFVQPSVGANAINQAQINTGDAVLVHGMGLIGQCTAMLARLRGAYVVGADVAPARIEIGKKHCVDWMLDSSATPPVDLLKPKFPWGVDVVMESTGVQELVDVAAACLCNKGRFVFEGHYPGNLTFRFLSLHGKQARSFFPAFIGDSPVREGVLRLMESRKLDISPLLTHTVSWKESEAFYGRLFTKERNTFNGIVFDWRDAPE